MTNFKIVVSDIEIVVFKNNVRYMTYFIDAVEIWEIADFYGVEYSEILYL